MTAAGKQARVSCNPSYAVRATGARLIYRVLTCGNVFRPYTWGCCTATRIVAEPLYFRPDILFHSPSIYWSILRQMLKDLFKINCSPQEGSVF